MAKTQRRVPVWVEGDMHRMRRVGDRTVNRPMRTAMYLRHPEMFLTTARRLREQEVQVDPTELLPEVVETPKPQQLLPVLGIWVAKTRRVHFVGPAQFSF